MRGLRLRLSLTLTGERVPLTPSRPEPEPEPPTRDTQLDAYIETVHDRPGVIGFTGATGRPIPPEVTT
jgi:hypothetical protein